MIESPAKFAILGDAYQGIDTAFSVLYGALQSDNLYLRDEPSVLAILDARVTLVGTRNADRWCGGLIRFGVNEAISNRRG
jgi:hypothetical protein